MKRAVAAALILLTACGGGDPAPTATTAPPATVSQTPTPTPTPTALASVAPNAETTAVRAAAARTLAACPCAVSVRVSASEGDDYAVSEMRGVYDPKAQTTSLTEYNDDKPTGLIVRIVNGRAFMSAGQSWVEVTFAKMPAADVNIFGTYALMDPRIAFAAASNASFAYVSSTAGTVVNDVTYDMTATAAKAGPWGAMLKRMTPKAVSFYGAVYVENGSVRRITFDTPDLPGKPRYGVFVEITKTGAPPQRLPVPKTTRTIDAATYKPSS